MTKRQRFLISAIVLSLGFFGIQLVQLEYRYAAVVGFLIISYLVSAWALLDDLKGVEWITILALPSMFVTSISLFYFLLPSSMTSRIIIFTLFGLGLYALYLTENIFSVAAVRTIQLLRAAHAVGFLMSILTLVLFYNSIFSLRIPIWANAGLVFIVSVPVMMQALWSVKLEKKLSGATIVMSLVTSLILAEIASIISLLPFTVWIASLFLATAAYVMTGLLQNAIHERLFERTVYEYLGVGMFVLVAALLVTPWH